MKNKENIFVKLLLKMIVHLQIHLTYSWKFYNFLNHTLTLKQLILVKVNTFAKTPQ